MSLAPTPCPQYDYALIDSWMEQADRLVDCGGDPLVILELLDRIVACGANNAEQCAEARWWRGQMLFKRGEHARAVLDFDAVLAAWGERHPDVFAKRAVAHALLQNDALAAADVATLYRIDPRSHWFLHYIYNLLHRDDLSALDLLIVLQPTVALHYFRRALHRRSVGDSDGARCDMEQYERLSGCV